jgi:hypothetical protein
MGGSPRTEVALTVGGHKGSNVAADVELIGAVRTALRGTAQPDYMIIDRMEGAAACRMKRR